MSLRRFFSQSSWYLSAHFLSTLLGLIAFPLWTRVFSVREYGMFAVLGVTIAFISNIAQFGMPKAAMRFFSEFDSHKRTPKSSYYTTFVIGALGLGVALQIIYYAVLLMLGPGRVGGHDFYVLYLWAGAILFLGPVVSVLFTFLRAEERAKASTVVQITRAYLGLGLSVLFVVVFSMGLKGLYISGIILGCGMASMLIYWLWRQRKLVLATFSTAFLIESIRFGFPLLFANIGNTISAIGDRYVLQIFMGPEAVGLYSAGYGVTSRINAVLSVMLVSVTPIYLSIWEKEGRKKTEEFLSNILDFYLMMALPAILFFSFFGGEVLTLFASAKYEAARVIIPYTVAPIVFHGAISIYTAGIYINKKTSFIMYFTISAGVLNVILNIILVPIYGIVGAAVATLISYIFLITLSNWLSSRFIKLHLNYRAILKYILASGIALLVVLPIHFEAIFGILIKLLIATVVYIVVMLAIDRRIRQRFRTTLGLLYSR